MQPINNDEYENSSFGPGVGSRPDYLGPDLTF